VERGSQIYQSISCGEKERKGWFSLVPSPGGGGMRRDLTMGVGGKSCLIDQGRNSGGNGNWSIRKRWG